MGCVHEIPFFHPNEEKRLNLFLAFIFKVCACFEVLFADILYRKNKDNNN